MDLAEQAGLAVVRASDKSNKIVAGFAREAAAVAVWSADKSAARSAAAARRASAAAAASVKANSRLAVDLTRQSLTNYESVNRRALDSVDRTVGEAFNFSAKNAQLTQDATRGALEFVDNFTRSDQANSYDNFIKYSVVGVVGVSLAWAVSR
jgi:hypothetical protein